jgi:hypothetical protein
LPFNKWKCKKQRASLIEQSNRWTDSSISGQGFWTFANTINTWFSWSRIDNVILEKRSNWLLLYWFEWKLIWTWIDWLMISNWLWLKWVVCFFTRYGIQQRRSSEKDEQTNLLQQKNLQFHHCINKAVNWGWRGTQQRV